MKTNIATISLVLALIGSIVFPEYAFASETNKVRGGDIYFEGNHSLNDNNRPYKKEDQIKSVKEESINIEEVNDRQILVKTKGTEHFIPEKYQVTSIKTSEVLASQDYQLIRVPEGMNFTKTLHDINELPMVEQADPDYLRQSTYVPSDLDYHQQWYMDQMGMKEAWQVNRGSQDVTVAILDTGVNANHPDLNGRVLPGYDFVNEDNNASDDNGHGTHIAGLISANADKNGIVGVDHNAKILPVKIMNESGTGSITDTVEGIYYAIKQGADIINMSYGAFEKSPLEEKALWEAYNQGIVLVAAAGNESTQDWSYPAAYAPVIGVAATAENDRIAPFSNYGEWIDLTAPGVNMYSTNYTGGYKNGKGTSYSAPLISGLAALIKSQNPSWEPREIEWALGAGAQTSDGSEWNMLDGFGIVNASKALTGELPGLEADASDRRLQGKLVTSGETVNEKIELPMDTDWFHFTVEQKSPVTINLSNVPEHIDLVGILTKDGGNTEVSSVAIDDTFMGEGEQYSFEAEPGEYYFAVYDYFNHWSEQSYNVEVVIENNSASMSDDSTQFPDVIGSWALEEINYLVEEKLIEGYPNGNFGVYDDINRASAATMIVRELELPLEDGGFRDVSNGHWASKYIGAAAKAGIITGYNDNTFKPDQSLTRQEMATILVRAYDLQGSGTVNFTDVSKSSWSYDYIDKLVANKITNGFPDQTFKPSINIKRSEFSVMIARVLNDSFRAN